MPSFRGPQHHRLHVGLRTFKTGLAVALALLAAGLRDAASPCFAAIGAIKREMNSAKWTWFAIGYQTLFAYAVSLCVYQLGLLATGGGFGIGTVAALLVTAAFLYLLFRSGGERRQLVSAVKA